MTDYLTQTYIADIIDRAFAEDFDEIGDITCASVIDEQATLTASMNAREDMVLAGLNFALSAFKALDPAANITTHAADGDTLSAGSKILTIDGNARALLMAERTALNIMQHLSGIATATRRYVDAIKHTNAKLLDTRKTHAGLRLAEKYATAMGGATNHRIGLFDAIMIKDNHLAVCGSVEEAVAMAKSAGHEKIQVECDTIEQVSQAINAGATSLLLDNMTPDKLRQALSIIDGKAIAEASGGVTLATIKDIAETGVDFISVGRITQSSPAIDIGLDYGT